MWWFDKCLLICFALIVLFIAASLIKPSRYISRDVISLSIRKVKQVILAFGRIILSIILIPIRYVFRYLVYHFARMQAAYIYNIIIATTMTPIIRNVTRRASAYSNGLRIATLNAAESIPFNASNRMNT